MWWVLSLLASPNKRACAPVHTHPHTHLHTYTHTHTHTHTQELNHYGGVIYALKSRTDIQSIADLRDKIVTASNFKLMQHQWRVFEVRVLCALYMHAVVL